MRHPPLARDRRISVDLTGNRGCVGPVSASDPDLKQRGIEVLAPAGSWESLSAGLQAGADSVYFGVGQLNMRARAALNFGEEDLPAIVERCHASGARAYLTLNNIIYDDELAAVENLCARALSAGVDAVICHDFAVLEVVAAAGLPIHLSTQANVSNFRAVKAYARYAEVIVLARELGLAQIAAIHRQVGEQQLCGPGGQPLRLEAFVHGALCVAISGKCQMSLYQFNHSANRGDCLQSCRRAYTVTDSETGDQLEIDNNYVMSPKDLCTIGCLDQLLAAGIDVLKIEGRGRSADYVATTVSCYREAVAAIRAGSFDEQAVAAWRARLASVFNRGFWEGGYYLGHTGSEWSGYAGNRATVRKFQIGRVNNYYATPKVAELELFNGDIRAGDALMVIGPTTGSVRFIAEGMVCDGQEVQAASRGQSITVQVPVAVRRNDKVFLLQESRQLR